PATGDAPRRLDPVPARAGPGRARQRGGPDRPPQPGPRPARAPPPPRRARRLSGATPPSAAVLAGTSAARRRGRGGRGSRRRPPRRPAGRPRVDLSSDPISVAARPRSDGVGGPPRRAAPAGPPREVNRVAARLRPALGRTPGRPAPAGARAP